LAKDETSFFPGYYKAKYILTLTTNGMEAEPMVGIDKMLRIMY
jgi:hypothetical protein